MSFKSAMNARTRELGISNSDLARRAGLSRQYIAMIEMDKIKEPSFEKGLKIAIALDVDPHTFGDIAYGKGGG